MQNRPTLLRSLVAALAAMALVMVLQRFVFWPVLGIYLPFLPLLMAVLAVAWWNGSEAGYLATFIGTVLAAYYSSLHPGFLPTDPDFLSRLSLFVLLGGLVSALVSSRQAALRQSIERQRQLEREVAERRHAEEQFQIVAMHAPVGIFLNDPQGQCVFVNHAWCEITGATAEAARGDGWQQLLHSDDRQRVAAEWSAARASGRDLISEHRMVHPQRGARSVIASVSAIRRGTGELDGFVGSIVDVTGARQAEAAVRASEDRLQAIVNNSLAVIYLKDLEGRYLTINRRFEELFHIRLAEVVGKVDGDLFPKEVSAKLRENDRQVLAAGKSLEFEEVVPQADGQHTYISVKFPVFDSRGQAVAVGGISTDITDRKAALEALEAEQELLQHTIFSQDQERQFITYELHDGLVQYVTGALMQLEALGHAGLSPEVADSVATTVAILRKAVAEGRRLINGMHHTVLDDCGLVAAVRQLVRDEEPGQVQVELVADDGLGRMAPKVETALYHIAREALTNVRKHSRSQRARMVLERQGDRVRLEVRDWGVGLSGPQPSTGVHGLRVMNERARIAGGTCTVANAQGSGARVVVDLPYERQG